MSGSAYYQQLASQSAAKYGVPQNVFLAQINQESGFNPNAYNDQSGATGIAQFLPSTANNAGYGIQPFDPTDPQASLDAAAQYDAALYQANGQNWDTALSKYSGGGYTASSLLGTGGVPGAGGGAVGSNLGSLISGSSWASSFQEWFVRIAIVVLGIGLLIVGVVALKSNAIQSVVKKIPKVPV